MVATQLVAQSAPGIRLGLFQGLISPSNNPILQAISASLNPAISESPLWFQGLPNLLRFQPRFQSAYPLPRSGISTDTRRSCRSRYSKLPQQMECIRKAKRPPRPKAPSKPPTAAQLCRFKYSKLPQIMACIQKAKHPTPPRPRPSHQTPRHHKPAACVAKPWVRGCR